MRSKVPYAPRSSSSSAIARAVAGRHRISSSPPRIVGPSLVVCEVGTHLELDQREPVGYGLACQPLHFVVVVAQPSRRGGVRRIAALEQMLDTVAATALGATQDRQRLVSTERVADVTEVDLIDQFDWTQ